ncbi:uncharacterized protein LOC110351099 isoform X7 [Heterocephalus glaber]|uniref:Uncharacterized protein LOC110351099 isoform X7 n=1 Tax=Heterocephalus glaber TaxID=10181 RepID=A0AAX6TLK9_HETGA|nr:uncharacterized protein LOC110351099 isoform X7 [Heterocephalus glaber]
MAKSPCFRPLTRSCLAIRGSTGRVSPDPETWGPEMSGSPGQISRDLDARHSGPPSPGQVQSGPATAVSPRYWGPMGGEPSRGLHGEDGTGRHAAPPPREPPEWDFLDSHPIHMDSLLDPSGACIPALQEGMVGRTSSSPS